MDIDLTSPREVICVYNSRNYKLKVNLMELDYFDKVWLSVIWPSIIDMSYTVSGLENVYLKSLGEIFDVTMNLAFSHILSTYGSIKNYCPKEDIHLPGSLWDKIQNMEIDDIFIEIPQINSCKYVHIPQYDGKCIFCQKDMPRHKLIMFGKCNESCMANKGHYCKHKTQCHKYWWITFNEQDLFRNPIFKEIDNTEPVIFTQFEMDSPRIDETTIESPTITIS